MEGAPMEEDFDAFVDVLRVRSYLVILLYIVLVFDVPHTPKKILVKIWFSWYIVYYTFNIIVY